MISYSLDEKLDVRSVCIPDVINISFGGLSDKSLSALTSLNLPRQWENNDDRVFSRSSCGSAMHNQIRRYNQQLAKFFYLLFND